MKELQRHTGFAQTNTPIIPRKVKTKLDPSKGPKTKEKT